jgi:hypothetical protein
VAGCCECGDEPSGSDATELVILLKTVTKQHTQIKTLNYLCLITKAAKR